MKLAAGVIFYNEVKGLKRLLDTLTEFDRVYCIDGRFSMYPDREDLSTDGSRELVTQYSNTVLVDYGGVDEVAKRNKYVELAVKDGMDCVLVIDADEWLVAKDWELFKQECAALPKPSIYRMYGFNGGDFDPQPRLINRPEMFEYYLSHCVFRFKPTGYYANHGQFSFYLVKGFRIMTDDSLRSPKHLADLKTYQDRLVATEAEKRYTNIDETLCPLDDACCIMSRPAPQGWVMETIFAENGKAYALLHNNVTGQYQKQEIPVEEAFFPIDDIVKDGIPYRLYRNVITGQFIKTVIKATD